MIGQDRPGHAKSRPMLTLETFNLNAATQERLLSDVIEKNVEFNREQNDRQYSCFARNLGLDFTRSNYFKRLKKAQDDE